MGYGPSTAALTPLGKRMVEENAGLAFRVALSNYPGPFDRDERISLALEGLLRAVQYFDPTRGFAFSTFATVVIRCHLRHSLRRPKLAMASLDDPERGFDPAAREDTPAPDPHNVRLDRLDRAIARLPPRLKLVMRSRLDGITLEATGREIGVTKERVRQLEKLARDRLWAAVVAMEARERRAGQLARSNHAG